MSSPHIPDNPLSLQSSKALRVLLYIEDNAANLSLVEGLIERRDDLTLLSARAGYPGIELARSHQPDMIIMDINLPDINGIEVLKILRTDPATAQVPVIALSSDAYPRQIEKGIEAGFFRYMTKPFRIDEFMTQIDDTLDYVKTQAALK